MSTKRIVAEIIAQVIGVTGFFHFTVNSDVATQQPNLGPQVNSILRHNSEMTMMNCTYAQQYCTDTDLYLCLKVSSMLSNNFQPVNQQKAPYFRVI